MSRKQPPTDAQLAAAALVLLTIAATGVAVIAPGSIESASILSVTAADANTSRDNVTVLLKNRETPLKMFLSVEPCAYSACVDI